MIPENKKKKSPFGDGPKMPKFNIYWIYGLIAISLLSARFFQSAPDIMTTSELEFKQVMLTGGDVEKIDLVQNKELVRVYIKPDSIDKDFYVQKLKRKMDKAKIKNVPLFEFNVTDWNSFNERLQRFYEQKKYSRSTTERSKRSRMVWSNSQYRFLFSIDCGGMGITYAQDGWRRRKWRRPRRYF